MPKLDPWATGEWLDISPAEKFRLLLAHAVSLGGVMGGGDGGGSDGDGDDDKRPDGGEGGGDDALKKAEDRAKKAEDELAAAKKAEDDRKAKAEEERRRAAEEEARKKAAKGGEEAERLIAEATRRAEEAEAQLGEMRERELERARKEAEAIQERFLSLPEDVRAELEPMRPLFADKPDAWGQLVDLHVRKSSGKTKPEGLMPSIGVLPGGTGNNDMHVPDRTRQLLDDYGYTGEAVKKIRVTEETDPVNGGSAVVYRMPLRAYREHQARHDVFEGTPHAVLEAAGMVAKSAGNAAGKGGRR